MKFHLRSVPSNSLLQTRSHLLGFMIFWHWLGTKCLNIGASGGHFALNSQYYKACSPALEMVSIVINFFESLPCITWVYPMHYRVSGKAIKCIFSAKSAQHISSLSSQITELTGRFIYPGLGKENQVWWPFVLPRVVCDSPQSIVVL